MEFKVGDVVQLKSGSPLMTIERIDNNGKASCVWFDQLKKVNDIFVLETLKNK